MFIFVCIRIPVFVYVIESKVDGFEIKSTEQVHVRQGVHQKYVLSISRVNKKAWWGPCRHQIPNLLNIKLFDSLVTSEHLVSNHAETHPYVMFAMM